MQWQILKQRPTQFSDRKHAPKSKTPAQELEQMKEKLDKAKAAGPVSINTYDPTSTS
jgi:hypothetical protein